MSLYKVLHPRGDIDYMTKKKKRGRGVASIGDCVDASIQELEEFIKNRKVTNFSSQ